MLAAGEPQTESHADAAVDPTPRDSFAENNPPIQTRSSSSRRARAPRVAPVFYAFLIGMVCLFAGKYLGRWGYACVLLSFLTGVALAVLPLLKAKRDSRFVGRNWQLLTGLTANALLLFVTGVAIPAAAIVPMILPGKSPEWREYVSHSGRYSMQLPSEPKEEVTDLHTKVGRFPSHRTFTDLGGRSGAVSTGYIDFSNYYLKTSVEEVLDEFFQQSLVKKEGEVTSRRDISRPDCKGFEVEDRLNSSTYGFRLHSAQRVCWVADRQLMYIHSLTAPAGSELYQKRSKFFDSFQLLDGQQIADKQSYAGGSSPIRDAAKEGNLSRPQSMMA